MLEARHVHAHIANNLKVSLNNSYIDIQLLVSLFTTEFVTEFETASYTYKNSNNIVIG